MSGILLQIDIRHAHTLPEVELRVVSLWLRPIVLELVCHLVWSQQLTAVGCVPRRQQVSVVGIDALSAFLLPGLSENFDLVQWRVYFNMRRCFNMSRFSSFYSCTLGDADLGRLMCHLTRH